MEEHPEEAQQNIENEADENESVEDEEDEDFDPLEDDEEYKRIYSGLHGFELMLVAYDIKIGSIEQLLDHFTSTKLLLNPHPAQNFYMSLKVKTHAQIHRMTIDMLCANTGEEWFDCKERCSIINKWKTQLETLPQSIKTDLLEILKGHMERYHHKIKPEDLGDDWAENYFALAIHSTTLFMVEKVLIFEQGVNKESVAEKDFNLLKAWFEYLERIPAEYQQVIQDSAEKILGMEITDLYEEEYCETPVASLGKRVYDFVCDYDQDWSADYFAMWAVKSEYGLADYLMESWRVLFTVKATNANSEDDDRFPIAPDDFEGVF